MPEEIVDHEHEWVYSHTNEDWWDGDEEDIYKCATEGCSDRKKVYIPR